MTLHLILALRENYILPFLLGSCKAAEIPEHGKVWNAEQSYTEVLQSQISRTTENTSSVEVRTWLQLMCCTSVLELGVLISEWRFWE